MRVALEGIKFNYDPNLAVTGAFNLRRNETQIVRVPEWEPGTCPDYECSPVAYAIGGLPKNMTIEASVSSESGLKTPLMIKAIAERAGHILGDVEARVITHPGSSGFVKFNLPNARVSQEGIGIHDIAWRWQYSDTPNVWIDFQTTRHRVYTTLARPCEPWEPESREPANIHQPWTEVLDIACRWARRVLSDPDEAAELITKEFFREVGKLVSYFGDASYAVSRFLCTDFLRLLKTGIGGNQTVNCDDCATVISTFSNIVGCELWQSSMGETFGTNRVVLIGAQAFGTTTFIHHAVAWKGQCLANDDVFDGCLQIDEDLKEPFIAVQPANIPFGNDQQGYRFSVVRNPSDCQPIPNNHDFGRRRRPLGEGYRSDEGLREPELISKLKEFYGFDFWPRADDDQRNDSERGLDSVISGPFLAGWEFHSGKRFSDERFPDVIQILLKQDESNGELIAVTLYECNKATDPNFRLLEILGRFDQLSLKQLIDESIGDVAFAQENGTAVVFRRDRFLAVIRSAGRQPVSVIEMAQTIDGDLASLSGGHLLNQVQRRSVMAHKMADLIRIFHLDFSGSDPVLQTVAPRVLDLRGMDANGNFTRGRITNDQGNSNGITGRAYTYKGDEYFTFTREDGLATFLGRLIFQDLTANPTKLVVIGSLITRTSADGGDRSPDADAFTDGQQEQVLVITKP